MKTIAIKDIAGYLPHDLKVQHKFNGTNRICAINSIRKGSLCLLADLEERWENGAINILPGRRLYEVTPVLRPLSDMRREITHHGKKIVPMVELTEMKRKHDDFYNDKYVEKEEAGRYSVSVYSAMTDYIQIQIIDFLHELKIDFRGLVDAGLAVDANTLEDNPYK